MTKTSLAFMELISNLGPSRLIHETIINNMSVCSAKVRNIPVEAAGTHQKGFG